MAAATESLILLVSCGEKDLQDLTAALDTGGFRVEAAQIAA